MSPIHRLNESTLIKTSHRHDTSLWFHYYYNIIDVTRRKVAGNDHSTENALVFQQILSTDFPKEMYGDWSGESWIPPPPCGRLVNV